MREEESEEITGTWWLPDSETSAVYGTIHCEPTKLVRARFEGEIVIDAFSERRSSDDAGVAIWGRTRLGMKCSLVRCWPVREESGSGGHTTQEFVSDLLILGAHVRNESDILIDRVEAGFLHLANWVADKAFAEDWCFIPWPRQKSDQLVLGAQEKSSKTFTISCIDSQIHFHSTVTSGGEPYRELHLQQTTKLVLEGPRKDWFSWYLPKVSYLEGLFSLLVQQPVRLTGVKALLSDDRPSAFVFPLRDGHFAETTDWRGLAIPLPSIEYIFSNVLQSWFQKEELLRTPVELYLESLHYRGRSHVATFLQLMAAIEVFHRGVRGGEYLEESDFDSLRKELLSHVPADLPSDFRASFGSRLEHANEYSLGKRFKLIRDEIPQTPGVIIRDTFWKRVVDARNYFTHYSKKPSNLRLENLPVDIFVLQKILSELVLTEIGIPREIVREGLSRHYGIYGLG